jgi:hypothetical protein
MVGKDAPAAWISGTAPSRSCTLADDTNTASSSPHTSVKQPLSGGSPQALAASQIFPLGIALDATNVYWTNFGSGEVKRVSK